MSTSLQSQQKRPWGVRIEQSPHELRLWCSWFSPWALGDSVAAVFIVWVFIRIGTPFRHLFTTEHMAMFAAAACAMAYYCLARMINDTSIAVLDDEIRVRHGPFPYRRGQRFEMHKLDNLELTEVTRYYRRIGRVTVYSLWAVLRDGRHIRLLREIHQHERVTFIQDAIEQHLGLE